MVIFFYGIIGYGFEDFVIEALLRLFAWKWLNKIISVFEGKI